jgi:holliday junction DNA helicase RuvA
MISYLVGQPILEKDFVTILVQGVGYGVRVTTKTMAEIVQLSQVELYIYTHVKEEALELFGFQNKSDRELFLLLIDVSGVGPKTALNILNYGSGQIIQAVQQADVGLFASVPRVGKKLAQKIIIDLRTKLGSLKELNLAPTSVQYQEVVLALQSLGFEERSINTVLEQVDVENLPIGEAVKMAVKELGKHRST